jgi:hypothetical protein
MTDDKRTKGQLLNDLYEAEQRAERAESAIYRATQNIEGPAPVPEASALASCVRALEPLKERAQYSSSTASPDRPTIERVLRSLAGRYGINLVEIHNTAQPCERRHLDEASEGELMQAIRYPSYAR